MRMVNLVCHSILLASEDWCKAASAGKVRVYDFFSRRKKGIRSLGPGSVCVVLTLGSRVFYGEFTVTEVKLVDASEYQELASKGLIHKPQQLKSSDKVWVLFFDEFVEYPIKVHKKTLTNVKTATSKKPISEWVITGQSYIDDQALEEIRKIAGKGLESHECIEMKLLELGDMLGYKTYTADAGKKCGDRQLGELMSLKLEESMRDTLGKIDVVWYDETRISYKLFEVVLTTDIRISLTRFVELSGINADFFIVAYSDRKQEFDRVKRSPAFSIVRNRTKFIDIDELNKLYELTKQWVEHAKILNLPYLQGAT
jgi:hypothetical protein